MTAALYRYHEQPAQIPAALIRPFIGGPDVPFSTRDRDVVVGVTKPSAATTGPIAGTIFTHIFGSLTITADTVLDSVYVHGRIFVMSGSLVIRNSIVRASGPTGGAATGVVVNTHDAAHNSVLIEDCEIFNDTSDPYWSGIIGGNIVARRCDIHDCSDLSEAFDPTNGGNANVLFEACWFHDFMYYSPFTNWTGPPVATENDDAVHPDGCQLQGGDNVIFRGCFMDMTESTVTSFAGSGGHVSNGVYGAALTVTPTRAPITSSILFEKNWLDHGHVGVIGSGAGISGITVQDNRFGRGIVATTATDGLGSIVRPIIFTIGAVINGTAVTAGATVDTHGNVWEDDDTPVSIYGATLTADYLGWDGTVLP